MNFQEAERTYKDFKAQHDTGKLNDAAFETEVGKLRLQDEQGRWWQIGVQTGEWYMHDGQKWNKAKPPAPTPPPVPAQDKVPPVPVSVPAPKPVEKKPEPKPEPKPKGGGGPNLPARLFSSKPAGREGGLSRPVLIGIIAAVAVIILLFLVGIYFLANNFLGGTAAKPPATATRVSLVLPTLPPPTVAPTLRPTDIPLPPTPVITATVPLTIPLATRTRALVSPTATKKPGTPTSPTPTLPNVPPGVYATKVEMNPATAGIGSTVAFKVTFLNTTGSVQTYKVMVKGYQCPSQCQDYKNSWSETVRADFNLPVGTSTIITSQNINLSAGISCDLVIIPHYIDPTNQQVIPFPGTNNPYGLYQPIQLCR